MVWRAISGTVGQCAAALHPAWVQEPALGAWDMARSACGDLA